MGGYGDRLQKVEVLEHLKNETGLANLSFYRGYGDLLQKVEVGCQNGFRWGLK